MPRIKIRARSQDYKTIGLTLIDGLQDKLAQFYHANQLISLFIALFYATLHRKGN